MWSLVVKKAKELKDKKLRAERLLLECFPARMIHREDTDTVPGRDTCVADFYHWLAIVVFRQFISSAYISNMVFNCNIIVDYQILYTYRSSKAIKLII